MITSPIILINDEPISGAVNPWECHYFKHKVLFTENPNEIKTIEWKLEGVIPNNITIDDNGLISGKIEILDLDQNGITEDLLFPKENIKEDGSNWTNTGRYKNDLHIFNFTIVRLFLYEKTIVNEDESFEIIEIIGKESLDVSIHVIKNNNIDNYIFIKRYLESGWKVKVENKDYFYKDFEEFIKIHPGPFGCE